MSKVWLTHPNLTPAHDFLAEPGAVGAWAGSGWQVREDQTDKPAVDEPADPREADAPADESVPGCCTGVDAAVKCDVRGNRVKGVVLGMDDAVRIYSRATALDPFDGQYPPTDTGSSALGACKAQAELGLISRYEWIFDGVDGILAAIVAGHPVGVGTWWLGDMFQPDPATGLVSVTGRRAGGHQWTVIGYRRRLDAFVGQCWWGRWGLHGSGRFLIRRPDLATLLADDGDAHVTYRAGQTA